MEYTETELQRLHAELYDILQEIIRVCDVLQLPYFIQGGSGIGAHFFQGIIPWDDDIDVGLTRDNYKRFVQQAPAVLRKGYTLQWLGTEPDTPFYFAKVRKDNTAFVEELFAKLPIHQGIYVDVFPFDKVPDNQRLQRAHRAVCNFLNTCFMGKSIWQYKYFRKCDIAVPRDRGIVPCFFTWLGDLLLPKRTIYGLLQWAQSLFNGGQHTYYNMVLMPRDHISVASIENPQQMPFGPLMVTTPADLETYLRHHYPRLRKWIPKEEQVTHKPTFLSFDSTWSGPAVLR